MPLTLMKNTFSAWIDIMPGSGAVPTLHVVGKIQASTSGWQATLKPAMATGVDPAIRVLDVASTAPAGIVLQVITILDVSYEERPTEADYEQATIRCDGDELTVDVGHTS